jgi:hypothetical protein
MPLYTDGSSGDSTPTITTSVIAYVFDPAEADAQGDVPVEWDCDIVKCVIMSDIAGDAVVDIWNDSSGNYPPTNADSITASAPPTLSSEDYVEDETLTGWTTSLAAGSTLRFNVDSAATLERVTVALTVEH